MNWRILALSLWLPSVAWAETVHETVLENGLKVIVKEDHRAPVVTSQVWYKIGSSYEQNGKTGVSHVLEHMMFKGTEKLGPGEFSRIMAAHGANENAFTGPDYTAYFQTLGKDFLHVSFEHEADRMRNLKLLEEEFVKENQVVMEERRLRTDDNPNSLTYEAFRATAFQTSPYRNPVIGWMQDLEGLQLADLRDWYLRWYAPNNATVVVAGDVEPKAVFALAEQYFGPLKPFDLGQPLSRPEVEQFGMKQVVVKRPAKLPQLIMGYKTPVLKTVKESWEAYALEMLAWVLDGDDSSRFTRELVRGSEIAVSAGAGYDLYERLPSLFTLSGIPSEGHTVEELQAALKAQLERVKTTLVEPKELERIKTQLIASKVYEKDSIFYQAMQIGMLETVGLDWRLSEKYVDEVSAITPEQIQAVAQKYLIEDRLTVAILEPLPLEAQP